MGQVSVKLYNASLEEKLTKEVEQSKMYMLFDEDSRINDRQLAVTYLLPSNWSDTHKIYATANCGEPYIFNQSLVLFQPTKDDIKF
jgi:hypothetical protein